MAAVAASCYSHWMKTASAAILSGILFAMAAGPAAADECRCIANGERFELGSVVCLRLPSGNQLARCGKVLNNTSWKMIGEGCPLTSVDEQPREEVPASAKPG